MMDVSLAALAVEPTLGRKVPKKARREPGLGDQSMSAL